MMLPELARRNRKIVRLRTKGLSLAAIGREVGLSAERVRQILRLMPGSAIPPRRSP
jgi:DNA-directed RNA polymerase sigma subunit (sigma70/sigma32)